MTEIKEAKKSKNKVNTTPTARPRGIFLETRKLTPGLKELIIMKAISREKRMSLIDHKNHKNIGKSIIKATDDDEIEMLLLY
jgi:hypothetical protein